MKIDRQKEILRIISEKEISTQEELCRALKENGYSTTQATISRDIRELRLRKKHARPGVQIYKAPEARYIQNSSSEDTSYIQILISGIKDITGAVGLVVVKTYSGMAMAVGAAIDSMDIEGVAGCIAGDDTIFVALKGPEYSEKVIERLKSSSS